MPLVVVLPVVVLLSFTMSSYLKATPRQGIAVWGRSVQGHRRYFSEVSEQFVAGKIYPKIQVARSGNV